ncbi:MULTISPECIES: transposase [unclassified Proteiniphilum]|jgi:transposase|uniref:transposase n=1 Tax=unclassified Proteiniphilum TaxID=2622718 RepID=UPI00257C04E1|nr:MULTISPECIES: transposase [unclassified Proteiniphilum]
MRKQRTNFDKAFKENAVKLSLERKNISELAQELGIAPFLLYRWRNEYQQKGDASFPGHRVQSPSEDPKRIAELSLYLTCVLDLFDRKLIGWSIIDHMNASHTIIPVIRMANRNRPFG